MKHNTVYLVSGANRGIGFGLITTLLLREDTTVVGTVRSSANTTDLRNLSVGEGSRLIIVTLDISSTSAVDIEIATKGLYKDLVARGITHIDTLIASAGIGRDFFAIKDTALQSIVEHFHVNTIAPFALFQALRYFLLTASAKFIVISSSLGSIEDMEGATPAAAYGISKAGVNYLVSKVHFEESTITALAIHPGWVKTENGQNFADALGVPTPPMSLEESVKGVLAQVDGATKETSSGTFVSYDGKKIAW